MQLIEQRLPGERIAHSFGMDYAGSLITTPLRAAKLAITRLTHRMSETTHAVVLPPDDAFLVLLYLKDVYHCDVWTDRPSTAVKKYPKDTICLVNLREGAAICIRSDFDALAFHVPHAIFDELTDEAGEPRIADLLTCRGIDDPVVRNLGAALLSMFETPEAMRAPLLAHIGLAFNAHLAHRYGILPTRALAGAGSLSLRQENRAKDFMMANFGRELALADIAAATGLSADELDEGFRACTGQHVEQWLLHYRIGRAKELLQRTGRTVLDIADSCGFSSEQDFSEAFAAETGVIAAAWRLRDRH